ncbi:MAG: PEPxxWA-CTERM sorting domain-containing protein [Sandarakinorhabdus sp.]|nr:PEPxxWA-CTERM sorting domain-containing protein [Sandarakinorhabdus sp.]
MQTEKARYSLFVGLSALALAVPGMAGAAAFTAVTTLDLSKAGFAATGFTYAQGSPAFTPVSGTLAVGDTLDFTINFKGAQTLTLVNPTLLWAYIYASTSSDVTGTGTLSLLGPGGAAFLTSTVKTDTEGVVHFGQNFGPGDFTALPAVLTFSGLHYVGTVDAYLAGMTSRDYATPTFAFDADGHSTNGTVPEPASWAMLIAGFGLVGAAARRRRGANALSA